MRGTREDRRIKPSTYKIDGVVRRGDAYYKCLGPMTMYQFYIKSCRDANGKKIKPIKRYALFSKIIRACNLEVIRQCAEESETVILPFRLGKMYIIKYKKSWDLNNGAVTQIDFKTTREVGHVVYYTDRDKSYRWAWDKRTSLAKNKYYYKFKPCRLAVDARTLAIRNLKADYFGKPIIPMPEVVNFKPPETKTNDNKV